MTPLTKRDIDNLTQEFRSLRDEMTQAFKAVHREIRFGVDDVCEQVCAVIDMTDEKFTGLETQLVDIRKGLKLTTQ